MITTIDGALFAKMVIHGSACINAQKQQINELNVFPVPDGDTGTNMSMTIGTAAEELARSPAIRWGRPLGYRKRIASGRAGQTPASFFLCCFEDLQRW